MNTSFERIKKGKDEWLTPPEIIRSLGTFDLDPCSPINRPWNTAKKHFTIKDNGLKQPWHGRVWCNPPYGNQTGIWLQKCYEHGNAIALTFARTETQAFFEYVWDKADAILFIEGRLRFYHVSGKMGDAAGAPSILIAYGAKNVEAISNVNINGYFIKIK